MKVTELPGQKGLSEAVIETLTGSRLLTLMISWLESAGLPLIQVAFDVTSHVTASPFEGV